ncbi:MAG: Holliday junction branch migration protein RuvA [Microlunatus sp.]|nr:Holliday junction branch migration protein RuvA [Microlunatus sp.]MDN5770412.1 Holliday junction branch migration protein RuvA [Microlunatus sp.]
MIAQLSGTVIQLGPTSVVIEVGGIGVLALCGPGTAAGLRIGEAATLATSLVVREDSLTLYGFAGVEERELFELLQTATGVGPKLAQAALAVLSPHDLRTAIATENLVTLCKVPGIGRKGAQRLVIELKDKIHTTSSVTQPVAPAGAEAASSAAGWRDQVSQGLQGLGWSTRDAEAACDEVEPLAGAPDAGVPQLMRAALQTLARR